MALEEKLFLRQRRCGYWPVEKPPGYRRKKHSSPERATDQSLDPASFQCANPNCILFRWFLHRLISAVPPGQRPERLFLEFITDDAIRDPRPSIFDLLSIFDLVYYIGGSV